MTDLLLGVAVLILALAFIAAVGDWAAAAHKAATKKSPTDKLANNLIEQGKEVE